MLPLRPLLLVAPMNYPIARHAIRRDLRKHQPSPMIQTEPEVCPAPAKRWGFRISRGPRMANRPWHNGRPYRRNRAIVLATSRVCVICGHDGSNSVDHVVPPLDGGHPTSLENLAPAHGVEGCPACPPRNGKPRRCNQEKGRKPLTAVMRMPIDRDW